MVRDALTGVYAKVALLERLEEEVHRGRRYGEPFSILLLDLDHFKSVNDAFGHARGDATLTEFVARVQSAARNSDVLFRYGGDEFVLFLPRTAHDQATTLAARLVEEVSGTVFEGVPPLTLTVSAGVATLPDDGSTAEDLLARADARMYEAKRAGRARVVAIDAMRDAELILDESTRLIERLDALERANRFFETLPGAQSGVLRVSGPGGSGRSRVLRELGKLAALRGHRTIAMTGRRERTLDAFAALREASVDASQLPVTLTDPTDVAEALRRTFSEPPGAHTTITIDNVAEVDRASLAVIRALLAGARAPSAVAVIHTGSEHDSDPAGPDVSLRDTIELRPLSTDGLRAWLRSVFRWEPPVEFIEWLHQQSGGMPGAIRQALLQLVEQRLLVRDEASWTLTESFRAMGGARSLRVPEARGIHPPQTELIGREGPLRQLLRLIRTTHLVTISGPGGSGKTRLALEAALEAMESFRDGVAFVPVPPRCSSIALASAIATTLDLNALAGEDPWIALTRELRLRKMLLVLDGLDSVAGASEGLSLLLEHAPELRVMVTARSRLQLNDEWVFHLEGLRVPKWPDPERARGFSAVQLFTERALVANPHFSMADADAPSVSRICQLLDGTPLAIEIAAAQTATLACREIANELESALEGLTSYLPATPPDQQRFRAVMEQTWRLLSEETRSVLRRAAVFPDDFDTPAAAAIVQAQPADLQALVAQCLLTRETPERYRLHPLVREYAAQKLEEFARDRHAILNAFATYYLEQAREWSESLRDPDTASAALAAFTTELANIRRAWSLVLVDEQHSLILNGGRALYEFYQVREYRADAELMFADAIKWLDSASPVSVNSVEPVSGFLQARHGACLMAVGRVEEARRRLTVALGKAKRSGISTEETFCLRHLAMVEQISGNVTAAEEYARAALAAARRSNDDVVLVQSLRLTAQIAVTAGASLRALECLLEAVGADAEGTSSRLDSCTALLDLVEQLAHQGNARLAGPVLLQILSDDSIDVDVQARALRVLDSLHASVAEQSAQTGQAASEPGNPKPVLLQVSD